MTEQRSPIYCLRTEERPSYMYASISSLLKGPKVAGEYVSELVEECARIGCSRLLIEKDIENSTWIWDSMSLIEQFPRAGLAGVKIALIDHSSKGFGNDGFGIKGSASKIDLHVFDTFVAGERWLVDH